MMSGDAEVIGSVMDGPQGAIASGGENGWMHRSDWKESIVHALKTASLTLTPDS